MATRKSPLRQRQPGDEPARIEYLHVENYQSSQDCRIEEHYAAHSLARSQW